ncbi:MAG: LLM class flavin-dependent oxidoreductase, partial [Stackebrandtia sp.]
PQWVEYHGKYYDFDRLMISPAPDRPVPIYVGGHSEAGLRRAARLADGWISVNADVENLRAAIGRLAELRAEYGRAGEPFEIDASPTDVDTIDGYRALADIGVTRCRISPWRLYGADPVDRQGRIDALRRFAEQHIV